MYIKIVVHWLKKITPLTIDNHFQLVIENCKYTCYNIVVNRIKYS